VELQCELQAGAALQDSAPVAGRKRGCTAAGRTRHLAFSLESFVP
jgi:hypothetical protein